MLPGTATAKSIMSTQENSSTEVPLNVSNTECALGVQVNGSGQVSVQGDINVSQQVLHNHMEECQVDRLVHNVKRETDKTVESVNNEVKRSGKKVEKEFKRFIRRF